MIRLILLALALVACATATPAPVATAPAATLTVAPTPEPPVVMARCAALADEWTYLSAEHGYCFTVPDGFELREEGSGPLVLGPALDSNLDPIRAKLTVEVSDAPGAPFVEDLAAEYRAQFDALPLPPIEQQPITLGGEPALRLEVVPGREGSRDVMALHDGKLYHLRFMPSTRDFPIAEADVEALYEAVMASFVFLPAPPVP